MNMLNRPVQKADVELADSLSGTASGSMFSRIAGGVIASIVVGLLGCRACLIRQPIGHDPIMSRNAVIQIATDAARSAGKRMADFKLDSISYDFIERQWSVLYDLDAQAIPPGSEIHVLVDDCSGETCFLPSM